MKVSLSSWNISSLRYIEIYRRLSKRKLIEQPHEGNSEVSKLATSSEVEYRIKSVKTYPLTWSHSTEKRNMVNFHWMNNIYSKVSFFLFHLFCENISTQNGINELGIFCRVSWNCLKWKKRMNRNRSNWFPSSPFFLFDWKNFFFIWTTFNGIYRYFATYPSRFFHKQSKVAKKEEDLLHFCVCLWVQIDIFKSSKWSHDANHWSSLFPKVNAIISIVTKCFLFFSEKYRLSIGDKCVHVHNLVAKMPMHTAE